MELNTAYNITSKKQRKGIKSGTEKLSNTQTVNSSFNFSWGSAQGTKGAITGKVLRKKQAATTQHINTASKLTESTEIHKKQKQNSNTIGSISQRVDNKMPEPINRQTRMDRNYDNEKEHEDFSPKVNIKRKYKKDKHNAQFGASDDAVSEQPENKSVMRGVPKTYSLFNEKYKDLYVGTHKGKSVSEKVFTESGNKFNNLCIHKHLVSNLEKMQFTTLTTVQEKAIPVVLSGKDVLIRSQTGSGKTLAYAVPIMNALQSIMPRLQRKDGVQAIIVVPTRELALQTHELFNKINTFQWIVSGHICGGENRKTEKDRLRKGIHILIGTPGRLLDHVLHTCALKVDNVRCLVLDEADRLLDMGFRKDIISLVEELAKTKTNSEYDPMAILKNVQNPNKTEKILEEVEDDEDEFSLKNINSKHRQTILLSATLTKGVSELADFTMKSHVFIDALDSTLNSDNQMDRLVIPDTVKQEFILTYVKHRLFTLSALIVAKTKQNAKMFVFMASTQMVEFHYNLFTQCLAKMPVSRGKLKAGNVVLFDVDSDKSDDEMEEEEVVLTTSFFKLHGNMDQKTRKEVFTSFRAAKTGVLLCTDVAARGLDVPAADCIVQYTGPQTDEDYLHRVGRTGRAGQAGSAIIFLTHEEQQYITRLAEQKVFLKQRNREDFFHYLCDVMQEPDDERAAEALQRRYETSIRKNKSLHLSACLAYSTWSRFYNSYPAKMRSIFNFKNINLGHYATSFALRDTPSQISQTVRGEVTNTETPRLNKKLANHIDQNPKVANQKLKQKRAVSLIASEYSSGLEPAKKKKKKNQEAE